MNSVLLNSLADLFINLSAGWFGAAFIVPINVRNREKRINALIINLVFAIVSLGLAIVLRLKI